jgi:hypothetical protein
MAEIPVHPREVASRGSLRSATVSEAHEHPLVEPQVSHFRQVPLRTMVKLPHSEQFSPS